MLDVESMAQVGMILGSRINVTIDCISAISNYGILGLRLVFGLVNLGSASLRFWSLRDWIKFLTVYIYPKTIKGQTNRSDEIVGNVDYLLYFGLNLLLLSI